MYNKFVHQYCLHTFTCSNPQAGPSDIVDSKYVQKKIMQAYDGVSLMEIIKRILRDNKKGEWIAKYQYMNVKGVTHGPGPMFEKKRCPLKAPEKL